jgi:acyl carrier protein
MSDLTTADIRSFVLDRVADQLTAIGMTPADVTDDFDLLTTGTIDSLGLLELLGALEDRFGVVAEFTEMDPEDIGVIGPLCLLVVGQAGPGVGA